MPGDNIISSVAPPPGLVGDEEGDSIRQEISTTGMERPAKSY